MDYRRDDHKRRSRSRSPIRHDSLRHEERRRPGSRDRRRTRSRSPRHDRNQDRDKRAARSRSRSRSYDRSTRRSRSRSQERRRPAASRHSRSRSRSRERTDRRRRSRSPSSTSNSSDEEERRRRKKEKKEKKRAKQERKRVKEANSGAKWGKYGIISETDMFSKSDEFNAWLVEERMLNPETLPKDRTRKEFARFIEDYNTATLPHPKFYALAAHETRMASLRAGEILPPTSEGYDPAQDMRELQDRKRRRNAEKETALSKEQLEELRKVQQERFQVGKMRALGMHIAPSMGVRMDGTEFE